MRKCLPEKKQNLYILMSSGDSVLLSICYSASCAIIYYNGYVYDGLQLDKAIYST